MLAEIVLCLENALTVGGSIGEPMLALFMLQTLLSSVSGPSSPAPAAFNLIAVISTVVEVIAHTIVVKGTTTAGRHVCLEMQTLR